MSQEELMEATGDSRHEMFDPRNIRSSVSPRGEQTKEKEEERLKEQLMQQHVVNPFNFIEK